MKQYFIQFDFWNDEINKFFFGIVSTELNDNFVMLDFCRDIIKERIDNRIDVYSLNIKVKAFNNIT